MKNPHQDIVDTGKKFVVAVAGGGYDAFGDLTRYGGMSSTFLEGICVSDPGSMRRLLGGEPPYRAASGGTARMMARASYELAVAYSGDPVDSVGIGVSSVLAKPGGEREGREHRICIGIHRHDSTTEIVVTLESGMSRSHEEIIVQGAVIAAIRLGVGLADSFFLQFDGSTTIWGCPNDDTYALTHCGSRPDGTRGPAYVTCGIGEHSEPPRVVLPTSMNPLHVGHLAIIEHASKLTQCPVTLELCIESPDKPKLDFVEINNRVENTLRAVQHNEYVDRLIVTDRSLFYAKAMILPHVVFVVGADTMRRIIDPKYTIADGLTVDDLVLIFYQQRNSFLVYQREGERPFTLEELPEELRPRVRIIGPEQGYSPCNTSSTQLRREMAL